MENRHAVEEGNSLLVSYPERYTLQNTPPPGATRESYLLKRTVNIQSGKIQ